MARAASLKEQHALEERAELIRRKKEQLELDIEIAATTAKLAILQTSDHLSASNAPSDGMESYFNKEDVKKMATSLNPNATEYFLICDASQSMEKLLESGQYNRQHSRWISTTNA